MNSASTRSNSVNINLNNLALRKQFSQLLIGDTIGLGITELWCDDGSIADIEIVVACSKVIAGIFFSHIRGRFKDNNLQTASLSISRCSKYF